MSVNMASVATFPPKILDDFNLVYAPVTFRAGGAGAGFGGVGVGGGVGAGFGGVGVGVGFGVGVGVGAGSELLLRAARKISKPAIATRTTTVMIKLLLVPPILYSFVAKKHATADCVR